MSLQESSLKPPRNEQQDGTSRWSRVDSVGLWRTLFRAALTNLWFANHLGVRGIMSAKAYFLCSQFHKATSNLVYFAIAHVSEKIIALDCSLTRNLSYLSCILYEENETLRRSSIWRQWMQNLSDRRDFYGTHNSISRRVLLWLSKINSLKSKTNQKFKIALLSFVITLKSFPKSQYAEVTQLVQNTFVRGFARLDITMKGVRWT
jgi:hypothetical protein